MEKLNRVEFLLEVEKRRTDFSECHFEKGMDFSGILLHWFNFTGASLIGANLTHQNLGLANFTRADLRAANISESDLFETNFTDTDLRHAEGLGQINRGVKTIILRTKMTKNASSEEFLLKCSFTKSPNKSVIFYDEDDKIINNNPTEETTSTRPQQDSQKDAGGKKRFPYR